MMELSKLAPEILKNIAKHLDRKSLRNLRLVARKFEPAATEALFSEVVLKLNDKNLRRATEIAISPTLKHFVRTITISLNDQNCFSVVRECGCEYGFASPDTLTATVSSIIALSFPKLCTIHVSPPSFDEFDEFDAQEYGVESIFDEWEDFLSDLMSLMYQRAVEGNFRAVTSLNIDLYPTSFLDKDPERLAKHTRNWSEASQYLQELSLSNRLWYDLPQLLDAHRGLENLWLAGSFTSLRKLSLEMDSQWGGIPKLDTNKLELPALESLSLVNYIILSESKINWITSITTLQSLRLKLCCIPWILVLDDAYAVEYKVDTNCLNLLDPSPDAYGIVEVYENPLRWRDVCSRLTESLSNLSEFSIQGIASSAPFEQPFLKGNKHNETPSSNHEMTDKTALLQQPYVDLTRCLYTLLWLDDNQEELWNPGMLTDSGMVFEGFAVGDIISEEAFNGICGTAGASGKAETIAIEDIYTTDFPAFSQLFRTLESRRLAKTLI